MSRERVQARLTALGGPPWPQPGEPADPTSERARLAALWLLYRFLDEDDPGPASVPLEVVLQWNSTFAHPSDEWVRSMAPWTAVRVTGSGPAGDGLFLQPHGTSLHRADRAPMDLRSALDRAAAAPSLAGRRSRLRLTSWRERLSLSMPVARVDVEEAQRLRREVERLEAAELERRTQAPAPHHAGVAATQAEQAARAAAPMRPAPASEGRWAALWVDEPTPEELAARDRYIAAEAARLAARRSLPPAPPMPSAEPAPPPERFTLLEPREEPLPAPPPTPPRRPAPRPLAPRCAPPEPAAEAPPRAPIPVLDAGVGFSVLGFVPHPGRN